MAGATVVSGDDVALALGLTAVVAKGEGVPNGDGVNLAVDAIDPEGTATFPEPQPAIERHTTMAAMSRRTTTLPTRDARGRGRSSREL